VDGDASLRATGELALSAGASVTVAADRDLALRATELDVRATAGSVFVGTLSYWGARAQAAIGQVRVCARSLDMAIDRVSQHVKQAFRTVEVLDQLRAGTIDYRADRTASLRAENAAIVTRQLVKIDGSQIHIG
jgi:hypothetical protein